MTDNLKSKTLCDPAKNYTMTFYSYFSERNHILKTLNESTSVLVTGLILLL